MADYSGIVMNLRLLAADLETAYGEERGSSLYSKAADAIEDLLAKVTRWISVEERLPTRTNPMHARDTFLVRLESGHIMTLSYEYDNSDRCAPGMVPLFDEGCAKTVVPVTHWMPLPEAPKEDAK